MTATPALPQIEGAWRSALEALVHKARYSTPPRQACNPGHSLLVHPTATPRSRGSQWTSQYRQISWQQFGTPGQQRSKFNTLGSWSSQQYWSWHAKLHLQQADFMDHKRQPHWRNNHTKKPNITKAIKWLHHWLWMAESTEKQKTMLLFQPCSIFAIVLHLCEEKLYFSFYCRGEFLSCRFPTLLISHHNYIMITIIGLTPPPRRKLRVRTLWPIMNGILASHLSPTEAQECPSMTSHPAGVQADLGHILNQAHPEHPEVIVYKSHLISDQGKSV